MSDRIHQFKMSPNMTPGQIWYAEKRKDARWKKRSYEVMNEAGWVCEECGATLDLTVHHVFYLKDPITNAPREPWDYPLALLMCLCWECHKERQGFEENYLFNIACLMRTKTLEELKETPVWVFIGSKYA